MEYKMVFLRQSNWLIITRQNAYMYIDKERLFWTIKMVYYLLFFGKFKLGRKLEWKTEMWRKIQYNLSGTSFKQGTCDASS